MTVKSSISFTDRHHQYLKDKVEQGVSPSVSSLVAMGVERLMRDEAEQQAMLEGLKGVIEERMQTPDEAWVSVENNDTLFAEARERIDKAS